MLVAPAGYGKTTLARQWLANRPHAWYQGNEASADIAALGLGIMEAAGSVTDELGHLFREWLPTRRGRERASLAADFLAKDLTRWPTDAWLAIDDYHWLENAAEEVLYRITEVPGLRLLLTSRSRPYWATPRKLLYGEVYELGQSALAMSQEEAHAVLEDMETGVARGLVALADGWPAIIGLASFTDSTTLLHTEHLPAALHNFIADELYNSLHPQAREGVCEISLLPSSSLVLAQELLGVVSAEVLAEALRVGFLNEERPGDFVMHPLLRTFLRRKLLGVPDTRRHAMFTRVVRTLISEKAWEGAFDVIREFRQTQLLEELLEASLYDLLSEGHLSTVSKFVDLGRKVRLKSPIVELASAELAFREGFHERARSLSHRAADAFAPDSPIASKAFSRAGQSAYFSSDPDAAIGYFKRARELAMDRQDEQNAVWGHFIAAIEREDESAAELLREFEETSGATVDDAVRVQNARLHLATRLGALPDGLSGAEAVAGLIAEASDPTVRASFWHVYAGALRVAAFYTEAMYAVERALAEVDIFHLDFARPHVYLTGAGINLGLGEYEDAQVLLDEVERLACDLGDVYLRMNERTCRCRLHLLKGDPMEAARVTESTWPQMPSCGQYAELLACRALALSQLDVPSDPAALITEAQSISRENEASALCVWARSILFLDRGDQAATPSIAAGFRAALSSGIFDPLVFACRIQNLISQSLDETDEFRPALRQLLKRVDATELRKQLPGTIRPAGPDSNPSVEVLTPREREVLALLAESRTNKEIAGALFLSEATVKVHVRHILGKLGVRTRTAAAVHAVKMQRLQALESEAQERGPVQLGSRR